MSPRYEGKPRIDAHQQVSAPERVTGRHDITHAAARDALLATAEFRRTALVPLSSAIDNLVELRQRTYTAFRASLGVNREDLPEGFGELVAPVTDFADPLVDAKRNNTTWHATDRRWTS